MALSAILLLVLGAVRLPTDISDLPGNLAVETLSAGEFITPEGAALALASRRHSLTKHQTADRWFVAGRAYLVMGHARKAAGAFASGLVLAPGRASVWADTPAPPTRPAIMCAAFSPGDNRSAGRLMIRRPSGCDEIETLADLRLVVLS